MVGAPTPTSELNDYTYIEVGNEGTEVKVRWRGKECLSETAYVAKGLLLNQRDFSVKTSSLCTKENQPFPTKYGEGNTMGMRLNM